METSLKTTPLRNLGFSVKGLGLYVIAAFVLLSTLPARAQQVIVTNGTYKGGGGLSDDGLSIVIASFSGSGTFAFYSRSSTGDQTTDVTGVPVNTTPGRWTGTWRIDNTLLNHAPQSADFIFNFTNYSAGTTPSGGGYYLISRPAGSTSGTTWTVFGSPTAGTVSSPTVTFSGVTIPDNSDLEWTLSSNGTSPLPVKLIAFNAVKDKQSINLTWATASEINNSHFEIQRSGNIIDWQTVKTVEGNGNSNNVIQYQYTDRLFDAVFPVLYYRLKQVDFNGAFEYSYIISINADGIMATISPTIVTDHLNLNLPDDAQNAVIINQLGQVKMHLSVSDHVVNVHDFLTGPYFVVWNSPTTGPATRKFMK